VIDRRLLVCAVLSVIGHFVLARALDELPPHLTDVRPRAVEVRVVEAPPPPPPPPPPDIVEAPKPDPKPVEPKVRPRPQPAAAATTSDPTPKDSQAVVTPSDTNAPVQPVFGVTMESTSQGGAATAPVGNSGSGSGGTPAGTPAGGEPAPAHQVTKMPLPQGRCSGKYTDEARAAGIEGVVVLDLVVDERGRARDIVVVEGLGHGLAQAAIAALAACRFTPGERDGKPVAVRVRGFKIRFVLQE
jgi:protein TonB